MNDENKYPVLKIEMEGDVPLARNVRVSLDGVDISRFLRNLKLQFGVDLAMRAHLEVLVRPDIPKFLLDKIEVEEFDTILFEQFKESLEEQRTGDEVV